MAKIEVLAELLTEELGEFKKDISKLEGFVDFLKKNKVQVDVSEFKILSNKNIEDQKKIFDSNLESMNAFGQNLKLGNTYPKWLLGLFSGVLMLFIGFIIYAFVSIKNQHEASYQKGKETAIEHFQSFIESEAALTKKYEVWNTKNIKK